MAPRRGAGNIVRSGNAGNSKAKEVVQDAVPSNGPPRPPPLFPTGYKTPVQMLSEKCQKAGWERPIIDTVRFFSYTMHCLSVTLLPLLKYFWIYRRPTQALIR